MSAVEILAVLATLLSVIMLAKVKSSGWVYGIFGNFLYGLIFIEQKLYANVLIQIVFMIQGLFGILAWSTHNSDKSLSIKKVDSMSLLLLTFSTLGLSVFLSLLMFIFTDNKNPILDTVLSICSIVATIMMIKKIIQSWFFWIMIDIGYIYLFLSIGLWMSAVLYLILLILCIVGYVQWKKQLIKI